MLEPTYMNGVAICKAGGPTCASTKSKNCAGPRGPRIFVSAMAAPTKTVTETDLMAIHGLRVRVPNHGLQVRIPNDMKIFPVELIALP